MLDERLPPIEKMGVFIPVFALTVVVYELLSWNEDDTFAPSVYWIVIWVGVVYLLWTVPRNI